jgi:hypothetical protein
VAVSGDTSGVLQLATNGGTTAVTIDTSQNVGVGNTIPSSFYSEAKNLVVGTGTGGQGLTIYSGSANQGRIMFAYGTSGSQAYNGFIQYDQSSNSLQFGTNGGNERMRIDSSGNVMVGTTSAIGKFTVQGTSDVRITVNESGNSVRADFLAQTAQAIVGTQSNHPFDIMTNGTGRMRIDSSGRPLFNTTSALNAGYMSLLFDGSAYNGFTLKTSYATTGSVYLYFINSAGSVAGFVSQNGTTTVNYATSSDYRMKDNVKPITNALDKVAKLKPVTYTWKNSNNEQGEGFIAHELAEICPLAVSGKKDEINEDGTIKPQGIDSSKLVATLTAAIQEQQALITTLQTQVAELKQKVGA